MATFHTATLVIWAASEERSIGHTLVAQTSGRGPAAAALTAVIGAGDVAESVLAAFHIVAAEVAVAVTVLVPFRIVVAGLAVAVTVPVVPHGIVVKSVVNTSIVIPTAVYCEKPVRPHLRLQNPICYSSFGTHRHPS